MGGSVFRGTPPQQKESGFPFGFPSKPPNKASLVSRLAPPNSRLWRSVDSPVEMQEMSEPENQEWVSELDS